MNDTYFLFFDDVNDKSQLINHEMKVIKQNKDRSFKLCDLPVNINGSLSHYQVTVGPIVYVLHKDIDDEIIEHNKHKVIKLESVGQDKYHFVSHSSVDVKQFKLPVVSEINNFNYVYAGKAKANLFNNYYLLRNYLDGSVGIEELPIVLDREDCVIVANVDGYEENYENKDLITLEKLENSDRYSYVKLYDKNDFKVKVKK